MMRPSNRGAPPVRATRPRLWMRHLLRSASPSCRGRANGVNHGAGSSSCYSSDDSAPPPPRIAPVSGVLNPRDDAVVRPIAFKPPIPIRLPSRSSDSTLNSASPWDLGIPSSSASPSSISLESALRDKDAEVTYLRQTLEHNEQVIFRVYAEKEQTWHRDMRQLQEDYESKIMENRLHHDMITSQMVDQAVHLDDELTQVKEDYSMSRRKIMQLQEELSRCHAQLDDNQGKLYHKSTEVSILKAQLKECQGGNASRVAELFALKNKLNELQKAIEEKDKQISHLRVHGNFHDQPRFDKMTRQAFEQAIERRAREDTIEMERLRTELYVTRQNMQIMQQRMTDERFNWETEKTKVIRYQKQIQMCYRHVCTRNWALESEIQNMELENKSGESQC